MSEVIIRHSEKRDVEAIRSLYAGKAAYSGTLQLPFPSEHLWQSRLEQLPAGFYSLVAEEQGCIVGQIGFEAFQNPRRSHAGSFGMAVKDDCQGRGIGSQLLSSVIELADNWLNIKRIELTVYTDNESAIQLYKKHGFHIEGESEAFAFRNGEFVNAFHMARMKR